MISGGRSAFSAIAVPLLLSPALPLGTLVRPRSVPSTERRESGDSRLLRAALVSLALILANAAAAQEMVAPRIDAAAMDWTRAAEDGGDLAALNAASGGAFRTSKRAPCRCCCPSTSTRSARRESRSTPTSSCRRIYGDEIFSTRSGGLRCCVHAARIRNARVLEHRLFRSRSTSCSPACASLIRSTGGFPKPLRLKDLDPSFPGVHRVWHEFVERTVFEGGVARRTAK